MGLQEVLFEVFSMFHFYNRFVKFAILPKETVRLKGRHRMIDVSECIPECSCKHCANWKTDHNSTMRDHVNAKHMRMMLKCTHCVFETLR